jgi:GMP synthase (glutamine-hydrolysing)
MSQRILMVAHGLKWREQRAIPLLMAKGCEIDWRCPAVGDALPGDMRGHAGMVVLGGTQNVEDAADPKHGYLVEELRAIERCLAVGRPFLGICLGAQMLAATLGARVARHPEGHAEIGYRSLRATIAGSEIIPDGLHVYHWHYQGFDLPRGAQLLAEGDTFRHQAYRYGRCAYGIQFHAEATPEMIAGWTKDAESSLTVPGAHSRERQLADMARHDAPLAAWIDRFLSDWLEQGETRIAAKECAEIERN